MAQERSDDESDPRDVVALAQKHIGMGGRVFYAPSIPVNKEEAARFVHELHLPDTEAILVLHDGTVFGSAEEGFLATRRRLCWKNPWEHTRQIEWSDLDPATIQRDVGKVLLAGGEIALPGDLVLGVSRFLIAITGLARRVDLGPYRGLGHSASSRSGANLPIERVIALGRALVGEVPDVFYAPSIPTSKLRHARAAHAAHLPSNEAVAVLYDDTFFGSAAEGFLLTGQRLCWKSLTEPPAQLPWSAIDVETIAASGSYVEVMGGEIQLTSRNEMTAAVATLLRRITEEARAGAHRE